jgi:hypothetical protein
MRVTRKLDSYIPTNIGNTTEQNLITDLGIYISGSETTILIGLVT